MKYVDEINEQRKKKNSFFRNKEYSPLTSSQISDFTELNYYPVDENYKFEVELEEYTQKNEIDMLTSKGINQKYIRFGYIEFRVDSINNRLTIYKDHHSDYLFVPFKDLTSGKETYGAGRYVELEEISNNKYLIDFNTAYNPYCAYNDNWVCPLTPFENNLKVEIKAGEKNFT